MILKHAEIICGRTGCGKDDTNIWERLLDDNNLTKDRSAAIAWACEATSWNHVQITSTWVWWLKWWHI